MMSYTIPDIVSDIPTALPSGSQPHSVVQMHHVVHMRMHPSPLSLSDSDVNFRYSTPSDCYISISWPVSDKNLREGPLQARQARVHSFGRSKVGF